MGLPELAETAKGMAAHHRALRSVNKNVRAKAVERGVQAEEVPFAPTTPVLPAVRNAVLNEKMRIGIIIITEPEI